MSSLVREVLSATGHLGEKDDLSAKCMRLMSRLDESKADLGSKISSRYEDFNASFVEVSTSADQLDSVLRAAEALEQSVHHSVRPGLYEASKDVQDILQQMVLISESVQNANKIKNAYQDMERVNDLIDRRKYMDAAGLVKSLEETIYFGTKSQDDATRKSLSSIGVELTQAIDKIHYSLGKDWDEHVGISHRNQDITILKVDFVGGGKSSDRVRHLVNAMTDAKMLPYKVEKFAKKLLEQVLIPVMSRRIKWADTTDDEPGLLTIKFEEEESKEVDCKDVMSYLEKVFSFLHTSFDGCESLMSLLGSFIGKVFAEELIRRCLAPAVPDSRSDLEHFRDVFAKQAVTFQDSLVEFTFLKPDDNTIGDYVSNSDELFTNKRCQRVLSEGRRIMKEDLYVTKTVDPPQLVPLEETLKTEMGIEIFNVDIDEMSLPIPMEMKTKELSSQCPFVFPHCQVSLSTFKVVDLAKKNLEEAFDPASTLFHAQRLICTVRNLFEMYRDIIPVAHRDTLNALPQASAVAYNNYMYLAHQCLTLGPSVQPKQSSVVKRMTFADLVLDLRSSGAEIFLQQMRAQRDQLRSILRDPSAGLGQLNGDGLLPAAAEKCVRQASHQILHLRKVWSGVLPPNVYRRAIGTIINSMLEELNEKTLSLEDIAADAATQICNLLSVVQEKCPQAFVIGDGGKAGDVVKYVKSWSKFCELVRILNVGLKEIEDRWSSGKGPLAADFTPEEVKRLIRALFQNTDRRAGVLSRIK